MLFISILLDNFSELIPYNVTITSHLIIRFTLSFFIFIEINILAIKKYKLEIFSLFMPTNLEHFYSRNSLQVKNTLEDILEFLLLNSSFPRFVGVVLITLIFFNTKISITSIMNEDFAVNNPYVKPFSLKIYSAIPNPVVNKFVRIETKHFSDIEPYLDLSKKKSAGLSCMAGMSTVNVETLPHLN